MDKYLKKWLKKAFDAGYKAGYSAIDVDGFRNENGYFSFDEWIEFIECEGKETTKESGNCIQPDVSNRRELLLAYHEFYLKWRSSVSNSNPEYAVDSFLSKQ